MTRERHDLFEARSILNMLKGWNCASPTVFFSKESINMLCVQDLCVCPLPLNAQSRVRQENPFSVLDERVVSVTNFAVHLAFIR